MVLKCSTFSISFSVQADPRVYVRRTDCSQMDVNVKLSRAFNKFTYGHLGTGLKVSTDFRRFTYNMSIRYHLQIQKEQRKNLYEK